MGVRLPRMEIMVEKMGERPMPTPTGMAPRSSKTGSMATRKVVTMAVMLDILSFLCYNG